MIKNEETQKKLTDYSALAGDAITINDKSSTLASEFPAEFSQLNRFTNVVIAPKDIFVNTEQFIEIYKYPMNRRKADFFKNKAALQKQISLINKDTSLQLERLKNDSLDIKSIFTNF